MALGSLIALGNAPIALYVCILFSIYKFTITFQKKVAD